MVENGHILDTIDYRLLRQLQDNARITNVELARRLELSPTGLQKRLKKLENNALIERYATILNREALGFDMLCFINISLEKHEINKIKAFRAGISALPEVLECHHITGEFDYLLKIAVRNRKHLETFLIERLTPVTGIGKIRTSIVLHAIKQTTSLPI